jgi:hypothetical protein
MKKFLLVFLTFMSIAVVNKLTAQCTVSNVVINITNTDQTDINNIKYTVDVYFDMQNNSGNKWVFIHVWKQNAYPVGFFPASVTGTLNPPTNGTLAQGNLDSAILNIGFNNDNGTAGYLSYIAQGAYLPDPLVQMTVGTANAGKVLLVPGAAVGYQRYFMGGVTVVTGQGLVPPLSIKANLWSSQAAQLSKAQCWTGELSLTLNDPSVAGRINCPSVVEPRTLTFAISTTSTTALGGTWKAYVDNAGDGFDASDNSGANAIPDATGNYSNLTSTNPIVLNNITYTGGSDPLPVKPVYIVIDVSSPFVLNNALVYPLTNACASLPVSLRNFNAAQRSGKVALTWETDQENGNDGFEIQRRIGNGQYIPIGFVDSKAPGGTGGAYSYSFDDNQVLSNAVAYYRLRQVDIDNRSTYSEIKAIRSGKSNFNVAVYPNPSHGTTNVAIPEGVGKMDISLDDFTGKSIQRWSGLNTQNLQLTNLKAGLYMLRITIRETGEQITERIMVQ